MAARDPIKQLEADFAKFKAEISPDEEILARAKASFSALYTRNKVRLEPGTEKAILQGTYRRARLSRRSHQQILLAARVAIRSETSAYLRAARESVTQTLGRVEALYIKTARRYQNTPIVSYDALTEEYIRRKRGDDSTGFIAFENQGLGIFSLDGDSWEALVQEFEISLNLNKDLAKLLSKSIVEWQKFGDDKWRLWVAITALMVTLLLFSASQLILALHS